MNFQCKGRLHKFCFIFRILSNFINNSHFYKITIFYICTRHYRSFNVVWKCDPLKPNYLHSSFQFGAKFCHDQIIFS